MIKTRTFIILFSLLVLNIVSLFSYEKYIDIDLLKKSSPPRYFKDSILLTLDENENSAIYVRTNLDNWKSDHYFKKNLYNVFYLILPYREKTKEIQYKVNINGYWQTDPNNKKYTNDFLGEKISIIDIPEEDFCYNTMPVIKDIDKNLAKMYFRYYNPEAEEVNFICSIDNWCLFSHPMKKNNNGYWEITKDFSRGIFLYAFLVDGKVISDIENPNKMKNNRGEKISFFSTK